VAGQDVPGQDLALAISEFVASPGESVADEDGEFGDWIELYNAGVVAVDLAGWSLTDDEEEPQKWMFPARQVRPGEFLLVFASGKDRAPSSDPGGANEELPEAGVPPELHSNFRLSREGEYLALVAPDLTVVSAFSPQYPPQRTGASYGAPTERRVAELLPAGAPARFLVTRRIADLPENWSGLDVDDSEWIEGTSAVGYDLKEPTTFAGVFQTDVGEFLQGSNSSMFLRIPFGIDEDPEGVGFLELLASYESGFVAHVNGVEVARRNTRETVRHNSSALELRSAEQALAPEAVQLRIPPGVLQPGRNLLGIQALNDRRDSPDFLFSAQLVSVTPTVVDSGHPRHFENPSPAWPNPSSGAESVSATPSFVTSGSVFTGSTLVELAPGSPEAEIRYTLDGTDPGPGSTLYTGPFPVTATARVQARAFEPSRLASEAIHETFVAVDAETFDAASDVPLFLITTLGSSITASELTPMHLRVFDRDANGSASLSAVEDFAGEGAIKVRGSSTQGRPKRAYSIEIQDDRGRDRDVEILGLPEDSDWILYAAYNFDRALLRNPFIYEISNQVGRYAVRTRFCEVYVQTSSDVVTAQDYVGVYSFMEKIKRGSERVDVEALPPEADSEPEITGGYILKIDRLDPGDRGFVTAANPRPIGYVDPKEEEITPEQAAWIKDYFDAFGAALNDRSPDAERGYRWFIDVDAWVDHHLLNELTKNPDGYVLSNYFFKPRGGKIHMGPIWDFDRSMGPSDDSRASSPAGWSGPRLDGWWRSLFSDPAFVERYAERWLELRAGALRTENLHSVLDAMADEIRLAQARNFARWSTLSLGAGGWQGQVDRLKDWVTRRVAWMDEQLVPLPRFSLPGGPVPKGSELTLSTSGGVIYYTINGPDPRNVDGTVAPEAVLFAAPIVLEESARVRARVWLSQGTWSSLAEVSYAVDAPPLVVTEIHFDPASLPEDGGGSSTSFEFLEFQNIGSEPIDLTGLRYLQQLGRPLFDFSAGTILELAPGAHMVLVRDLGRFRSRYGDEVPVAGAYTGTLGNSRDDIIVLGPSDEPIVQFHYEGNWFPETQGNGRSLVIRDEILESAEVGDSRWSEMTSWRPSTGEGGSPGRTDLPPGGAEAGRQLPGDLDQNARLNLLDAVALIAALEGLRPLPCATDKGNRSTLDANGDQRLDLTDAVHLLNFLFLRGAGLAAGTECILIEGCPDVCAAR